MDYMPAFSGKTFLGDTEQLRVLVAVSAIQPLLTTQRARPKPAPDDKVVWPEGACFYEDAARFTPSRLESLRITAYSVAASTYFKVPSDPMDDDVQRRFGVMLRYMEPRFWFLPDPKAKSRDAFWHIHINDPVRDLTKRLFEDDVVGRFFQQDTEGYQQPALAASGMENVYIHTKNGVLPWSQVGHIGENRLAQFTRQMADSILACSAQARDAETRDRETTSVYKKKREDRFR